MALKISVLLSCSSYSTPGNGVYTQEAEVFPYLFFSMLLIAIVSKVSDYFFNGIKKHEKHFMSR